MKCGEDAKGPSAFLFCFNFKGLEHFLIKMKNQNQGGVMDHLISILKKTETLKSETCLV